MKSCSVAVDRRHVRPVADRPERPARQAIAVTPGGEPALLDGSGALVLPECRTVVFADLHFEKGSAFAERGALLPPYDSAATWNGWRRCWPFIDRRRSSAWVTASTIPAAAGGWRSGWPDGCAALPTATTGSGLPATTIPRSPKIRGSCGSRVQYRGLRFLHEPDATVGGFEICGHFHPKARIKAGPRRIVRPCFIGDDRLLILPSFGAYTGGLDIMNPAIADLFPGAFTPG